MRIMGIKKKVLEVILAGSFLFGCEAIEEPGIEPLSVTAETAEQTEADKLLLNFPSQIPRAEVRKYPVNGSRYLLVHIRQEHFRSELEEKGKEHVKKVQDDIYSILSYLIENRGLKRVYDEGVSIATEDLQNQIIGILAFSKKQILARIEGLKQEISELEKSLESEDAKKLISEKRNELADSGKKYEEFGNYDITHEAGFRLALEGKLEILGTGTEFTDSLASATIENIKNNIAINPYIAVFLVMDNRENEFLEIAAKSNSPEVIVIYGGLHAFGGKKSCGLVYNLEGRISGQDNIAEWNLKNPDKKFSLIELTPESFYIRNN